ncbi:IS3 family transposase [Thiohalophilus sp.]|uniref:IS3 family transposase n=1 Tax=Thiohalophilus sp. TaxID=3028392 RepID=UPI002ACEE88D|nr:IS3 family transposase [Thiohalophilus sp.]MDZ7803158.1 IS3 family transposase [Thiohalophilus sp.]MDZ7805367.1 IS3 family transposase [Thiohalophilus sp.]
MKYAFIREQAARYTVSRLCQILDVSASGYYDWRDRPESTRAKQNRALLSKITVFHRASRGIYGSPRIHRDLLESGEQVGENRVARLMRDNDIQSRMARKFVITTDSKNTLKPAPDRLQRQFNVVEPDKAWVSDTTFIPTRQGWLYLAVVLELYSRQILGWAMGNKNNAKLVQDALTMAVWRRGKVDSVIVHSDQGSTYASGDYQKMLKDNNLLCSMSRKGECLDNAVAESFFGTLKTELVDHEDYRTKDEAKRSLFEYMEIFYNKRRRHSYLGYVSPVDYEARFAS